MTDDSLEQPSHRKHVPNDASNVSADPPMIEAERDEGGDPMTDAKRRERVAARYRAAIRETEIFEDATRGHDCGEAVDKYIDLLEQSCSDVPILLQREAALLKVAELADETWVAYMAGLITTNPDGVFDRLRLALHECEKGRTP